MDLKRLVDIAARALLDHHFPGRESKPVGAVERARADAQVVVEALDRYFSDDLK